MKKGKINIFEEHSDRNYNCRMGKNKINDRIKVKKRTINWLNGLGLQLPVPNNINNSMFNNI